MNPGATGLRPEKTKIPGYKQYQVSQMGPAQMNLLSDLIQKLSGGVGGAADYLTRLSSGDESLFSELEKPAYTAFEKLLGQTGTRFSDLGARDSSYFENAVAGQGAELAQNLQAQRLGLRNQAIESLLGQAHKALGYQPYESIFQKKEQKDKGNWWELGGGILGGIGGLAVSGGNPYAGMGGYKAGSTAGRTAYDIFG